MWLWIALVSLCWGEVVTAQTPVTIWATRGNGNWFVQNNWSNGVPNQRVSALIADGSVFADLDRITPNAANLTVGADSKGTSSAALSIVGGPLRVHGALIVGNSTGGEVTGAISTSVRGRLPGDVEIQDEIIVGVVDPFVDPGNGGIRVEIDDVLTIPDLPPGNVVVLPEDPHPRPPLDPPDDIIVRPSLPGGGIITVPETISPGGLITTPSLPRDNIGSVNTGRGPVVAPISGHEVQMGGAKGRMTTSGSLRVMGDRPPRLHVGLVRGHGSADGRLDVAQNVGDPRSGFSHVGIAELQEGATGAASGAATVGNLYGSGADANLIVGSAGGAGNANGSLTAQDVSGFGNVRLGQARKLGSSSGRLVVNGTLAVPNVVIGNGTNGVGELVFDRAAAFKGDAITVNASSQMSMGSVIAGDVANHGVLSITGLPSRAAPGETRIDGNLLQTPSGAMEFDIRGPEAGTEYEFITTTDLVSLDGRIDLNFDSKFQPKKGQTFSLVRTPFARVNNLHYRLLNPPADLAIQPRLSRGLHLDLVPPVPIQFANPKAAHVEWADVRNWPKQQVPWTVHQVELFNAQGFEQTIFASKGGTAQSLALGGASTVSLVIPDSTVFSATHQIQLDNNGSVELQNGRLMTAQVDVNPGGSLIGRGLVVGDIINDGLVQIGDSKQPERIVIQGDYVQSPGGILELDVFGEGAGQFDQLVVEGSGEFKGKLHVNLRGDLDTFNGLRVPLLRVTDGILGELDIRVFSGPGIPLNDFDLNFGQTTSAIFFSTDGITPNDVGDMNLDGIRNEDDVAPFGLALADIDTYITQFEVWPTARGDVNRDGELDLDDIEPFVNCIRNGECGEASFAATIPEPNTESMLWMSVSVVILIRRRRRQS